MTSPDPEETIGGEPGMLPPEPAELDPGARRIRRQRREHPVIGWARAVALGIRDTAGDVVREGREGARRESEELWQDYEAKTKRRRGDG